MGQRLLDSNEVYRKKIEGEATGSCVMWRFGRWRLMSASRANRWIRETAIDSPALCALQMPWPCLEKLGYRSCGDDRSQRGRNCAAQFRDTCVGEALES